MPLPLLFESWDCRPATVPPRSRLYSLKPIGIGTPFVESLTGYVSRLADAHAVSVGNLVGRELSLVGSKPTHPFGPFVPRVQNAGSHGFCGTRSANGLGEIAKRWVVALERGTLQRDLRFLTLLPFEGVFSKGRIFRRTRAWCSACYAHWRCTGATVYEPLLWTMRLVTICPRHSQPLDEVCPNCGERMKPLGAYARPGHCSKCLQWLAAEDTSVAPTPPAQKSDADAVWRAQALGELVGCGAAVDLSWRGIQGELSSLRDGGRRKQRRRFRPDLPHIEARSHVHVEGTRVAGSGHAATDLPSPEYSLNGFPCKRSQRCRCLLGASERGCSKESS